MCDRCAKHAKIQASTPGGTAPGSLFRTYRKEVISYIVSIFALSVSIFPNKCITILIVPYMSPRTCIGTEPIQACCLSVGTVNASKTQA